MKYLKLKKIGNFNRIMILHTEEYAELHDVNIINTEIDPVGDGFVFLNKSVRNIKSLKYVRLFEMFNVFLKKKRK